LPHRALRDTHYSPPFRGWCFSVKMALTLKSERFPKDLFWWACRYRKQFSEWMLKSINN
jgi:hypothetical protein